MHFASAYLQMFWPFTVLADFTVVCVVFFLTRKEKKIINLKYCSNKCMYYHIKYCIFIIYIMANHSVYVENFFRGLDAYLCISSFCYMKGFPERGGRNSVIP